MKILNNSFISNNYSTMKKLKIKTSFSRFIKCHILCARSAFIEKNAMAALQDSFNDLSKFNRLYLNVCMSIALMFGSVVSC